MYISRCKCNAVGSGATGPGGNPEFPSLSLTTLPGGHTHKQPVQHRVLGPSPAGRAHPDGGSGGAEGLGCRVQERAAFLAVWDQLQQPSGAIQKSGPTELVMILMNLHAIMKFLPQITLVCFYSFALRPGQAPPSLPCFHIPYGPASSPYSYCHLQDSVTLSLLSLAGFCDPVPAVTCRVP